MIRAAVVAVALMLGGCASREPDAIPNVKLGMAPGDVRDRFEPGGPGTWQTSVGKVADDTALEWKAKEGSACARVREARFEFHLGMLVAVRATTNEAPPSGEKISATAVSVTVRRAASSGGTDTAVLARDCPTHKEEAASLVARMK